MGIWCCHARAGRMVSLPFKHTYLAHITLGQHPPHRPRNAHQYWWAMYVRRVGVHMGVTVCSLLMFVGEHWHAMQNTDDWVRTYWTLYFYDNSIDTSYFQNPAFWRVFLWIIYFYYYENVFTDNILPLQCFQIFFFKATNPWLHNNTNPSLIPHHLAPLCYYQRATLHWYM